MEQLICHLLGDFVFQNEWMAGQKTKSSFPAAVHAICYTSCFLLLTFSPWALVVIGLTHFAIDRWQLAGYWIRFYGVGCRSWLDRRLWPMQCYMAKPDWLAGMLRIVVDNTMHLVINYLALRFLA